MDGQVIAEALGWAGAVLAIGLNVPQAWTSAYRQRVAGVSASARWLALAHSCTWLVYGLAHDVPLQVWTNGMCVLLHLAVLGALLALCPPARASWVLVPQAGATALWLAGVVACAVTGHVPVGVLAAAVGALAVVPQLWQLERGQVQDTSGISATTLRLTAANGMCWAGHGLLIGAPEIVAVGVLGAAAAGRTLALLGQLSYSSGCGGSAPSRRPSVTPALARLTSSSAVT